MNCGQVQVKRHHSIQADTTTSVRWNTYTPECINVLLDSLLVGVKALESDVCFKFSWEMQTLASGENLLSAHEEVVSVGDFGILGIRHGIEWSRVNGEFIEDVEVSVEPRQSENQHYFSSILGADRIFKALSGFVESNWDENRAFQNLGEKDVGD
jgi:hypothetical protein